LQLPGLPHITSLDVRFDFHLSFSYSMLMLHGAATSSASRLADNRRSHIQAKTRGGIAGKAEDIFECEKPGLWPGSVFVAVRQPAISPTPRQSELHALKKYSLAISSAIPQLDSECGENRRTQPQSIFQERKP
jgi:hypothetical protein